MRVADPEASDIRRVVTGLDDNNKAKVIFDSRLPLPPGPYGIKSTNLWLTDTCPIRLSHIEDTALKRIGISPPENGTKFQVVEFAPLTPEIEEKMDPQFLMKAVGQGAPQRGLPVSHPMMHRTRSVDYAVVLSGEIDMILDDSSVHLKPGDVIVQQATNHGWINHGKEPCRMLFVLMDAEEP
jgi:mannose-6-phosphate isomerase-like protein (cupin superfamily)